MEAKAVAETYGGFITLKGSDGVERPVSKKTASLTLGKVLEYCNKHGEPRAAAAAAASAKPRFDPAASGSSSSAGSAAPGNNLEAWDREFLGILSLDDLYELLLAASYLEIELLLDATCEKVADMIKGKTTRQIRATFNLTDDLTPAEEELRRRYGWFFDE
ncbi:unnamed protein product [Urochloa decumbens]|uniref:SKP1-like protein n=1 Tax=Urochloa decumbens TaxID=240449 RepID=A0ABC9FXU4_9POAL